MSGHTTVQWWQAIKDNPFLLEDWLTKQLRGEVTAVTRLEEFCQNYVPPGHKWLKTLRTIQDQERQHAEWVRGLLEDRGFSTEVLQTPQRYWTQTLGQVNSFESAAAASAYAETMRLARIRLIASDEQTPADIREKFRLILPQEIFHAKAFRQMAGDEAMQAALQAHQRGINAIGLIPAEF